MHLIQSSTADGLYEKVLREVAFEGVRVSPRGLETIELAPAILTLTDPTKNIVTHPNRGINLGFMAAELVWMLAGRDDVGMISFYNKRMKEFSDDGAKLSGAYGPRLMPQLKKAFEALQLDPDTRQAVVTLWKPLPEPSRDIPCTVALHFLLRQGRLNLNVYMRSNDAWLGLPYDLHNFTSIQILLATLLKVDVGVYHHIAGSLHVYDEHATKILFDCPPLDVLETPKPNIWSWDHLEAYLVTVQGVEELIRGNHKTAAVSVEKCPCPFFKQKLQWMLIKARSKHAKV